jgi:hypothetical protein
MVAPRTDRSIRGEELLARLTAAAYGVALRHGLRAPFIDVELDLWRVLRDTLALACSDGSTTLPQCVTVRQVAETVS